MTTFFVAGVPIQQGSARAFVHNGKATITSDTRRGLKDWRGDIRTEAQRHFDALIDGPVHVAIEFVMPRPKSTPKRVDRPWHTKTPDLDKLQRAAGDAMTGVVFRDDSQVAWWDVCKVLAAQGEQSGAWIEIRPLSEGVERVRAR